MRASPITTVLFTGFMGVLFVGIANLPRLAVADMVSPDAASSDKDKDIPKVSEPSKSEGANDESKENFGRFVKLSKSDFDADSKLKAQFKNYGQYVKSLHHRDSDDHGRPSEGKGSSGGHVPGAGSGSGAGVKGSHGHGAGSSASSTGSSSGSGSATPTGGVGAGQ